jgi:hypothetical protein
MAHMDKILKPEIAVIYGALFGAIAGDLVPTPGDFFYFKLMRELRDKWTKGEITSKQYWSRETLYYYLLNSSWWALVFLITYNIEGDFQKKLKIALALTGAGLVVGVILKNIQKDEQERLAEKNLTKEQLYQEKNGKST